MLPADFRWRSVASRADQLPDAIYCGMTEVLRQSQRVDDKVWWVEVDRHLGEQHRGRRICTSDEQGKVGAALWAARHQVRLRAQVGHRIKQLGMGKPFLMRWWLRHSAATTGHLPAATCPLVLGSPTKKAGTPVFAGIPTFRVPCRAE